MACFVPSRGPRATLPLVVLCVAASPACGASTGLDLGAPGDGGPPWQSDAGPGDAGPADGGVDAGLDGGHALSVTCPPDLVTRPLVDLTVVGVVTPGDADVVEVTWRIVSAPDGSAVAREPVPGTLLRFAADLAGDYVLELEARDAGGAAATCRTRVRAAVREGLRVEMFWDQDTGDLDLHVLRPGSEAWFDRDGDCHYVNCVGEGLPWGGPGTVDDPRLDLDDTDGRGPENVNIDEPAPGTYAVGVDFFDGRTTPEAGVTVRIYCGSTGDDAVPDAVIGPTVLAFGGVGPSSTFWRVAQVDIGADGTCAVRPITGANRITTRGAASLTR